MNLVIVAHWYTKSLIDTNFLKNRLMRPHHGSKTSSSPNFLDALRPQIGVVQAGYRNRFGHPAEAVVMRYRERNIPLAETPACGAVGWRSDRPEATVCEREHSLRYWHHRVPSSH